ncbi:hypothetical protein D3C84_416360 [compost metagenome]
MFFTDVAHAASQHDRLVVTANFVTVRGGDRLFEGTEVAGQGRTAEFIVERRATQRAFDHDVQCGNDAVRLAVRLLPRLFEARDLQIGHGETGEAGLWLGTATGGTFVADLTAGAGRGSREWRDRSRVVVSLDLHKDMHRLLYRAVLAGFRIREEASGHRTDDHRGVVLVSGQYAFTVHLVGVLDHAEQAFFLALAVDVPTGVEDLVTAVLGVGLGEHHQFDVVRVALEALEAGHQVVDLVFGKGQAQLDVGRFQRGTTATEDVDGSQRLGLGMAEQAGGFFKLVQYQLSHAVVKDVGDSSGIGLAQLTADIVSNAALQALDAFQPTVVGDVAGLARPGRDGAKTRDYQEQAAAWLLHRYTRAVLQKASQYLLLFSGQGAGNFGEVSEFSIQATNSGDFLAQLLD